MVKVSCDHCGESFEKAQWRVDRTDKDFCSLECHNADQKENPKTGEDAGNYKGGGEYTCRNCGEVNHTTPSKAEEAVYCDRECMAEDLSDRYSGEDNPSYDGGLEQIECEWCGDTAEFVPAEAEKRRFCCMRCYKDWLSHDRRGDVWMGEDNPAWRGGQERHRNYGPNWEEQREAALKRDDHECMLCRSTSDLHVHHKKPIRNFDRSMYGWWRRANELDNLITLCRSCHMTVHANPEEYLGDYLG